MLGAIIGGFLGYQGAKKQADAQNYQNQLEQQRYEREMAERQPGIEGAQQALGTDFSPFIDRAGQLATGGMDVAGSYLGNVPYYQQAGLQGLQGYQSLLGQNPLDTYQQYADPYAQSIYDMGAKDINRQADRASREATVAGGRFGALGSQATRTAGEIEAQRQEAVGNLASQVGSDAYRYGMEAANNELARQQALYGQLYGAGTQGLQYAQQASQLGSGAFQQGIAAPFAPYSQYFSTIGQAPGVQAPQYSAPANPVGYGLSTGLEWYNALNPQDKKQ